jgi:alkylated DNA repair dioxygenase AlkB
MIHVHDRNNQIAASESCADSRLIGSRPTSILSCLSDPPVTCSRPSVDVIVIEPGLVLLRNFVSDSDCEDLARMALDWGQQEGEDGFYSTSTGGGTKTLNTGEAGRGRIYDAATRFPPKVIDHCNKAVKTACLVDSAMPSMTCTHLLLNMYTTNAGLCWHRDIYENDGSSDHPVVNLCVGASCKFGIKHNDEDPERVITLCSGDVFLFGGPCRLIKHAVLEVIIDDCPVWMEDSPVRFSFTFRDSPEVLGREEEFKYFKVSEHLVGQDEFEVPQDAKAFKGLPSSASQTAINQLLGC